MEKIKCLIIGSEPADMRQPSTRQANLMPVLYEGVLPGGQLTTTTDIENFLGYPTGISSIQMMEDLRSGALRFGTDIRFGVVTKVELKQNHNLVVVDGERRWKLW